MQKNSWNQTLAAQISMHRDDVTVILKLIHFTGGQSQRNFAQRILSEVRKFK
jgi:hypothetical protein